MADGGFIRELTETKERAAAWIIRLLITALMGTASFAGYQAWGSLKELKDEVKEQNRLHWTTIETLKSNQSATQTTLGILQQSVTDLHSLAQDHETRLRSLERPGVGWPH